MPAPYNENLSLYNWPGTESFVDTSDPDWFHHSGNGFAQGWDDTENLYYRALSDDTPDLNTESQEVRDYLVNAYDRYLDMGVDAFRVDTVKHMERDSVLYFVNAFKAHDPDLFLFGEVAQKRHELHDVEEINPHWYTWDGAVGNSNNSGLAVLDFYAEATFHGVFEENQAFSGVQAAARYDDLYSDPSTNVMWLDNHDFGPNNDWNRRFSGSAETLASYINFSWTWRGIPSLYYGTEIQFMKGAYTDIHEAADINRSLDNTGRAYYGDNIFSASGNPLYQHIKKMNAIRTALPALQKGSWYWAGNPSSGDGVGYVREYDGQTVAVGLAKNSSVSFHFTGLPAGIYLDAVTGAEVSSDGSLDFTVTSGSAGIYVLNGPGLIGALGAGFFQSSSDGQGGSDGGGDSTAAWNEAYFRGTPNDWGLTAMTKRADGTFETTQTFADADPRFKITRYQDWTAAVPAADFLISDGAGDYLIAFDSISGDITVTKQNDNGGATTGAWDQAWFRGTPNGWSSTAMSYNSASGFWESTQTFGADNPRFKVDHYADWTDAYPAQDFLITDGPGEYLIQFSDADYSLVVTRLQGSTYSLSGAVSMGGSPLNGITVSAGGQSAVSGADGSWSIAGLAPGDYTVGVSGGSYVYTPATQSVTIGSADISGINFTAALPGNDLVLHFAEYESADAYFLHPWDGLDGDRAMAYEGYINGRHWWTVSVTDAPASFMFCFTNSNNNWDGGNRSYSAQGDEVYILPWDSSVYLSRP